VPTEIENLVDKTWLFKVEAKPSHNPKFEQSFRVRKICTDDAIIKQFTEKWEHEEAVLSKNNNVSVYLIIFFIPTSQALIVYNL
jgi:endo-beta-N-acetylglucosaminidase D